MMKMICFNKEVKLLDDAFEWCDAICITLEDTQHLNKLINLEGLVHTLIIDDANSCNEVLTNIPLQYHPKHIVILQDALAIEPSEHSIVAIKNNFYLTYFNRVMLNTS